MSLSATPPLARTDTAARPARHGAPGAPSGPVRTVRAAGVAAAVGSTAWAIGLLVFDVDEEQGWRLVTYEATELLFQLGLVALVAAHLRTGAVGTGRVARTLLHTQHVLLGLAMLSTLAWAFLPGQDEEAWFLALDLFWPLSMLGMCAIGVRIAIAGRWRGAARFWPLVAESWAPVVIPASAALPGLAGPIGAGHLLLGYVGLGLVLALRPELTLPRDR